MEDIERDCEIGGVCVCEGDFDELVVVMCVFDVGLFEVDVGEICD